MVRAQKWLMQAKDDLDWLVDSLKGGHYAQTCFIAQQVGEKAVKALAYYRGAEVIKSHSILAIARSLEFNAEIEKAGQILDQYYMTTRYPDTLPDGYPGEYFTREQAVEAERLARLILETIESEFEK